MQPTVPNGQQYSTMLKQLRGGPKYLQKFEVHDLQESVSSANAGMVKGRKNEKETSEIVS